MIYSVKPPSKPIRATIQLPASKSISNRVLIIRALQGTDFAVDNLADCDDTAVLSSALTGLPETIDVGAAGTSMRFLTAYLSQLEGQEHVLTGSARMKQRPIQVLVDGLRQLGADIEYLEQPGMPPLRIKGKKLRCTRPVTVAGDVSSQYISAMLLIAPYLENGLQLHLEGELASKPYIQMTLKLMETFGASYETNISFSSITVHPGEYRAIPNYSIEPDWSAAAFWLEIASLRGSFPEDCLALHEISRMSLQGDSVARKLFGDFCWIGPQNVLHATYPGFHENHMLSLDFTDCPDLAQALVVTACLRNKPFIFTGLESLHIKETDRMEALKNELAKLGYRLRDDLEGSLMWQRGSCPRKLVPVIETYKDHRMAMALAPCCMRYGEVLIKDPGVVSKSYPRFWKDLRKAGFVVEEVPEW